MCADFKVGVPPNYPNRRHGGGSGRNAYGVDPLATGSDGRFVGGGGRRGFHKPDSWTVWRPAVPSSRFEAITTQPWRYCSKRERTGPQALAPSVGCQVGATKASDEAGATVAP